MKIGVDLDGTLDRPAIAEMVRAIYCSDMEVEIHIITATDGLPDTSRDAKREKLLRLEVPYDYLWLATGDTFEEMGASKAEILMREDISLMIDDSPTFVKAMFLHTQGRVTLLKVV